MVAVDDSERPGRVPPGEAGPDARAIHWEALGTRIRLAREQRGMTQYDLAVLIGWNRTVVSVLENGHRGITTASLQRIADALQVPIGELLGETPAGSTHLAEILQELDPEQIGLVTEFASWLRKQKGTA